MKKVTVNTKIKEIFEDSLFDGYVHMLDYRRDNPDKSIYDMTLAEFGESIGWSASIMADGFSYVYEKAEKSKIFYSFYSEDEKRENPDLKETGIAAFPVDKKSKFAVICPGGGYGAVCTLLEGYPLARKLNNLGYSVFIVNYRVGKKGGQSKPLDDLAVALKFIISNAEKFNVETENYCVIGFSAGAHLVSSWGVKEIGYEKYNLPKPGLLTLGYPVITMGEFAHEGSKNNFLGADANNEELIKKYSTELNVTSDYPPAFVWQCDGDYAVPLENSIQMVVSLRKENVPCFYEVYHYHTHGLHDDAEAYPQMWYERMCKFWEKQER